MKLTRHYLKEYNFLLSRHPSVLEDSSFIEHVIDENKEIGPVSNLKEIGDCRELESFEKVTVAGVVNAAKLELVRPESLLAILIPDDPFFFGMARAYQTFASENRKEVKIFIDTREALAWLGYNEEDIEILNKFVEDKYCPPQKNAS